MLKLHAALLWPAPKDAPGLEERARDCYLLSDYPCVRCFGDGEVAGAWSEGETCPTTGEIFDG